MFKMINISIDDVSPHHAMPGRFLESLNRIIDEFNNVKFSLFLPMALWRTMPPCEFANNEPLVVSEHIDFCETLRTLPAKNFELCYHGLFHGIPMISNNDEFKSIQYESALTLFTKMEMIASNAGLPMKKIFRPPAWRMSAQAIMAARDFGFTVLALSQDDYALESYSQEHEKKDDVVFYTSAPPIKPLVLSDKIEIVYHALENDKNFLNETLINELISFLRSISHKRFCFMEEMVA